MKKNHTSVASQKSTAPRHLLHVVFGFAIGLSVVGCANPKPSIKDDVWCAETVAVPRDTQFFDARQSFREGGLEDAVNYAEAQLGPLYIPSNEIGSATRAYGSKKNAALRGCNVLIILESELAQSEFGRGLADYRVLLARTVDAR